jgi:hypothetical protein
MGKERIFREVIRQRASDYDGLLSGISELLELARRGTARAVNSILTATYWEIGRRIVEYEQGGKVRAPHTVSRITGSCDVPDTVGDNA